MANTTRLEDELSASLRAVLKEYEAWIENLEPDEGDKAAIESAYKALDRYDIWKGKQA